MQHSRNLASLLILSFFLLIGCAGSQKATEATHPLAGSWAYSLDTPQGTYTGVINIVDTNGSLSGTIADDNQPDQKAPLENLMYDAASSKISFTFDGAEFGEMSVSAVLAGKTMAGSMNVGAYGVDVALSAKKKAM